MRYLFLIFIPVIVFTGCNPPSEPSEGEQRKLDWCSTPGKTLQQLGWVWSQNREIENYSSLLSDDYHFYFDDSSVGKHLDDGYVIPSSWDKNEDIQATHNMFNGNWDISLDITNWEDYDYDPGGTEFTASMVNFRLYIWPEGPDWSELSLGSSVIAFRKIDSNWLISGWHDDEEGALGMQRAQNHP